MKKEKMQIQNFEIALRMRDFEIAQLAQRNNFFMIFQGVLFAGLIQSSHPKPVVSLLVCVAGLIVSVFQVGMASGAKFWQEYWEQKLSEFEASERASDAILFHDKNCEYDATVRSRLSSRQVGSITTRLVMSRFSVSRIPIYTGVALAIIWLLLVLCTLRGYSPLSVPSFVVGF